MRGVQERVGETSKTVSAAGGKAKLVKLAPRLLRLTWSRGTTVEAADAKDVADRSAALMEDLPYAVVVDLQGISTIKLAARTVFQTDERVAACAMVGVSPMDQVLAAFSFHAEHPTRLLPSEPKALRWLAAVGYGHEEGFQQPVRRERGTASVAHS